MLTGQVQEPRYFLERSSRKGPLSPSSGALGVWTLRMEGAKKTMDSLSSCLAPAAPKGLGKPHLLCPPPQLIVGDNPNGGSSQFHTSPTPATPRSSREEVGKILQGLGKVPWQGEEGAQRGDPMHIHYSERSHHLSHAQRARKILFLVKRFEGLGEPATSVLKVPPIPIPRCSQIQL